MVITMDDLETRKAAARAARQRAMEVLDRCYGIEDQYAARREANQLNGIYDEPDVGFSETRVVYKTHDSPRTSQPVQPQTMSQAASEQWNRWAHREIDAHVSPIVDGLTDEIADITGSLERRIV